MLLRVGVTYKPALIFKPLIGGPKRYKPLRYGEVKCYPIQAEERAKEKLD